MALGAAASSCVLLLIFTVLPMAWMVLTSLKTQFAAMQYPPQWWPAEPTLENYAKLLDPVEPRRPGVPALLLEQHLRLAC